MKTITLAAVALLLSTDILMAQTAESSARPSASEFLKNHGVAPPTVQAGGYGKDPIISQDPIKPEDAQLIISDKGCAYSQRGNDDTTGEPLLTFYPGCSSERVSEISAAIHEKWAQSRPATHGDFERLIAAVKSLEDTVKARLPQR